MAFASLFTLIDDIAVLLDDVAVMTKVSAQKTAAVLGDDLALNAQQVTGVQADRELPVVWAVAKGSIINKVILVPCAMLISFFIPWLVQPLLMLGGLYLCFEGAEKILSFFEPKEDHSKDAELDGMDATTYEASKVKGAIRTDFVLSAEIIVITLGVVAQADFITQLSTLVLIATLMTVGVYGLVALIVKMDDAGLWLYHRSPVEKKLGSMLLWFAPKLMHWLSTVGLLAMFLVGGGILAHSLHHWIESIQLHPFVNWLIPSLIQGLIGVGAGFVAVAIYEGIHKLKSLFRVS